MINAGDHISIEIINDKELFNLFNDLETKLQNKIVVAGMKTAANIILKKAKENFQSVKKDKSLTNYSKLNSFFKVQPLQNPDLNTFGLKLGITKQGYKLRWINWGTNERFYKKSKKSYFKKSAKEHKTGKIEQTDFFYLAVESSKSEANNKVSQAIIDSLNKTVNKYNKTK